MRQILILLGLSILVPAFAADFCDIEMASVAKLKSMVQLKIAKARKTPGYYTENTVAANNYENLMRLLNKTQKEEFHQFFTEADIYRVLALDEMGSYARNLNKILVNLNTVNGLNQLDNLHSFIDDELRKILENRVPHDSIDQRIEALREGGKKRKSDVAFRALGDMTQDELEMLVHGGNPLEPTPESLLGKYLSETGATTLQRAFPVSNVKKSKLGEKRLVIPVSEESFPVYQKYFANENFLVHMHTPNQGTLMLGHNGMVGTYGGLRNELRFPTEGSIMPHILLKTTEGNRASNFFSLASFERDLALEPWTIGAKKNPGKFEKYCATGGYNSCTHWFGNIPVGDKKVKEYVFPGHVDEHASNSIRDDMPYEKLEKMSDEKIDKLDAKPRKQPLMAIGSEHELNPKVTHVWKVPGHQQLFDVLGLYESQIRGELANPGWVAISLLGSADVKRVPFVFVAVKNHKTKLNQNFNTQISAY